MKKSLIALALSAGFAFAAQASDIVDTAIKAGNFKTLVAAVQAAGLVDTLKGKGMAKDVKPGMVKTVQGSDITLATAGGVTVNGAKVVAADVAADNGVIHAIDTVIMPK